MLNAERYIKGIVVKITSSKFFSTQNIQKATTKLKHIEVMERRLSSCT
jgi:hypothetical protein